MRTDTLLIVGAGGHAKVVVDALTCDGAAPRPLALADDDVRRRGESMLGVTVRGPLDEARDGCSSFHIAIGHNRTRERLAQACVAAGLAPATVRHPRTVVAASATIGAGSLLAAGAIVGPSAQLGAHCIVNHGAVVDHDCVVGACTHIAPNASLGGGVRVGQRVLIGAGATLLPGVSVGDDCVVGAGAVVIGNLPAGSTFAGVPAQRLDGRSP